MFWYQKLIQRCDENEPISPTASVRFDRFGEFI